MINGKRETFPCNNNGCKSCYKTDYCDRYKKENLKVIRSIDVRLEGQKVLDKIEKYLY